MDLAPLVGAADRGQPAQILDRLLAALVHVEATRETRRILAAQLDSPEITRVTDDDRSPQGTPTSSACAALVLGSPEFQRR